MSKHTHFSLKKKLLMSVPAIALTAAIPLTITSCGLQQKDTKTPVVEQDKAFCFQNRTTFTVKNPSKKGHFEVKVNDNIVNTKSTTQIPQVLVYNESNASLTIQPTKIGSKNMTNKYTVSYFNDENEVIYDSSWYLNMETDFTLKIQGDTPWFHKFNPTLTIKAESTTGASISDLSWSYILEDTSATSYLEYFQATEEQDKTTLTLIKPSISKNTNIWIWAKNDKGKVGVNIPILKYVPPIVTPKSSVTSIGPNNITTVTTEFQKGSYASQNLYVGWNLYSASGQPYNVLKSDYTDPGSGIVYTAGTQIPLTSKTVKAWKEAQAAGKTTELYGSDSLEFLLADDNLGVFNGVQTVFDDVLKVKQLKNYISPETNGIQVQCMVYAPNAYQQLETYPVSPLIPWTSSLLSTSSKRNFEFDSVANILYKESALKSVNLCDVNDITGTIFAVEGLNNPENYEYKFDKYINFPKNYINQLPGKENNPVSSAKTQDQKNQDEGNFLFNELPQTEEECLAIGSQCPELFNINKTNVDSWYWKHTSGLTKDLSSQEEIIYNQLVAKQDSGNFWFASASLVKQLYMPVQNPDFDPSKTTDEIRDISVAINIKISSKELGKELMSIPLFFNLYNANRVISLKNTKYISDDNVNTIDIYKVAELNSDPSYMYQNELLVPLEVNGNEITSVKRSAKINGSIFTGKIRHISFETNSEVTTIADGSYSETENTGTFALFTNLRTVDFTKTEKLTRIGDYAFDGINSQNTVFSTLILPASLKEIGTAAFRGIPAQTVLLQGEDINVTVEESAFSSASKIAQFYGSERITNIASSAFYSCKSLDTFSFDNVKEIGESAFQQCEALTNIDFSNNKNQAIFSKALSSLAGTGKFIFSHSVATTKQIPLNILLGNQTDFLLTSKETTDLFPLFSNVTSDDRIINGSDSNIKISNISCNNEIYTDVQSAGLSMKKVNIYNFDQSSSGEAFALDTATEDLTFTDSKLADQFLNTTAGDTYNLKDLSFIETKLGKTSISSVKQISSADSSKLINQIQSFTFIAPSINNEEGVEKEAYTQTIAKDFFMCSDFTESNQTTMFNEYNDISVLTINIKMSAGDEKDTSLSITTFKYLYNFLYNNITCNDSLRVSSASFSMNTCINWVLWDE